MTTATDVRVPDELLGLFEEPALAHLSYHNDSGQIVTWPVWVDYDGERIVTSSRVGSAKGEAFRARPEVAVSIVSNTNAWRWLSVSGRVTDIQPDEDLSFIDKMAEKYMGNAYPARTPRENFLITIDRESHSTGG
jgi:hypothetical protein